GGPKAHPQRAEGGAGAGRGRGRRRRNGVPGLGRGPNRGWGGGPAAPPSAMPRARKRSTSRVVRRAQGAATVGRRSVKIWRGHAVLSQKNLRTRSCKRT